MQIEPRTVRLTRGEFLPLGLGRVPQMVKTGIEQPQRNLRPSLAWPKERRQKDQGPEEGVKKANLGAFTGAVCLLCRLIHGHDEAQI